MVSLADGQCKVNGGMALPAVSADTRAPKLVGKVRFSHLDIYHMADYTVLYYYGGVARSATNVVRRRNEITS